VHFYELIAKLSKFDSNELHCWLSKGKSAEIEAFANQSIQRSIRKKVNKKTDSLDYINEVLDVYRGV
jgi:hypothetical protein